MNSLCFWKNSLRRRRTSAADTVGTVEPDAGLEISIADYRVQDGEQTVSIAPEKAALEETLQKLDQ